MVSLRDDGMTPPAKSLILPPPLTGEALDAPHKFPQLGVPAEAQRSGFGGERRRKGVNGAFRPKGGNGVRGLCDDASGGLFRRSGTQNAESDYELFDFWTWSSRILHSLTNCKASIPPVSLRTPPPFTQGRHWCSAHPQMRRRTETPPQAPLRVGLGRPTSPCRGG